MRAAPWFAVSGALCLLAGAPALAAPCAGFTDVDDSSGFCTSIAWVKNRGITLGCTTTSLYCPTDFVTREQMAAFLYRLGFNNAFLQGGNAFGATAVIGTTDNRPVEVRANAARVMRYEPNTASPNLVGGHPNNSVTAGVKGATIAGGGADMVDMDLGRGTPNHVTDHYGTVGGGWSNRAGNDDTTLHDRAFATVGGGVSNTASGAGSVIAGGILNFASEFLSTIGGGVVNRASGRASAVSGGERNTASGPWSAIAGGEGNEASGPYSFAAGRQAKASAAGSFVWADSLDVDFPPALQPDFFAVRARGGVGFTVKVFPDGVPEQFCNYLPNTAGWVCTSDREAKENLVPVDATAVLESLTSMPLFYWNFKGAGAAFRNLGPTAQDFQAAFGLSRDDKTIASGHVEGVALAAIQGLNVKLEQREAALRSEVQEKGTEIAALRERLATVETAYTRDVAELRLAIEVLLARTSAEGHMAQTR